LTYHLQFGTSEEVTKYFWGKVTYLLPSNLV